ncbi:nuclear transport factor 2 family protein [Parabacteroides sp. FAFU027]|uniref:nuclear transport factor 2 family protein n=1 Tax=Parabacteroides sp. FAFU027 TaxID=2922715 RepID=UPI001FAF2669|nr:nuclear transport factor 2 family protein [Parabacteroides sp. FAFU027]
MKKLIILSLLIAFSFSIEAQKQKKMESNTLQTLQDKLALKELVDVFSILADQKEIEKQTMLFTEDATVETLFNGQIISSLHGRKQLGEAFGGFLNQFETVYHINGQQTVTVNGNKASGISYCLVTLIGSENGKKVKTTNGVYYNDEYLKQNGKWLIANRKSTFAWQDKQEVRP